MSERTIRRSIFNTVLAAFGLVAGSYRNVEASIAHSDRHQRIRNNYNQKADARVKKVAKQRKRNRIARRSRMLNRA